MEKVLRGITLPELAFLLQFSRITGNPFYVDKDCKIQAISHLFKLIFRGFMPGNESRERIPSELSDFSIDETEIEVPPRFTGTLSGGS